MMATKSDTVVLGLDEIESIYHCDKYLKGMPGLSYDRNNIKIEQGVISGIGLSTYVVFDVSISNPDMHEDLKAEIRFNITDYDKL